MLRFATSRVPLVTAGACGLRFQATQNAPGARRRNFRYRPTWTLPNFVIEDVQDDPARGSMIRVAVDRKQLLVSQYPQLGPRKTEANDPTPQFDRERRVSVRMRHMDLAGLVAVVEGRLPSHHMKNNAYDLVFEKNPEGYSLKGQVHRATSTKSEEWAIQFNDHHATTIEHFLESALAASFGFEQYNAFVRQANNARQNGGNAGNNNNNYGNRRNYNNGNNNGRRNNNNNNNNNNQRQQFIQ